MTRTKYKSARIPGHRSAICFLFEMILQIACRPQIKSGDYRIIFMLCNINTLTK